jgi:hypothetical protein
MGSVQYVLAGAIQTRQIVRLAYRRKEDEVITLHEVAPLDIRRGDSSSTALVQYLWTWCYAQERAEIHLLGRIVRATTLTMTFDPDDILGQWPTWKWPLPSEWSIPRDW